MCLQCSTQATLMVEKILPGWQLYQAMVTAERWPAGWYGLVQSNDPALVFPAEGLCSDPCANMTDVEIDALSLDSPEWRGYQAHSAYVRTHFTLFKMTPKTAWRLVQACIQAGYKPEEDGDVEWWLIDYIARKLQK